VAEHLLSSDAPKARESLGYVRDSSRLVLSELATMLGLLRTRSDPADGSVVNTTPTPRVTDVGALVDSFTVSGLAADLSIIGDPQDLSSAVELTTYRLIQEALTNAHKHGTGSANVTLTYTAQALDITVVNSTRPNTAGDRQEMADEGFGLIGMRERVSAVGGSITAGHDGVSRFVLRARLPALASSATTTAQQHFSLAGGEPLAGGGPLTDTAGPR
jgi:signal transduction histidine kinase